MALDALVLDRWRLRFAGPPCPEEVAVFLIEGDRVLQHSSRLRVLGSCMENLRKLN